MVGSQKQVLVQQISERRVQTMMSNNPQRQRQPLLTIVTIAIVLLSFTTSSTNAFTTSFIPTVVQQQQQQQQRNTLPSQTSSYLLDNKYRYSSFHVPLASANTDEGTTEQEQSTSTTENDGDEVPVVDEMETITEITATDDTASTEVPAEVIVEDPEVTAMKEEITKMELEMKSVRRQLADLNDRADDYTKTGYARKVAEMENMRRARSMLQSSNKYSATAAILTEFLPAMDALNGLKERYESNEFGKMYNALPDAIRGGFTSMGCTEYNVEPSTIFDANRMTIIDTEPSTTVPKDSIIRTIIPGMELQGNTIRLAQVVTSSGNSDTAATSESPSETTEATN